MPAVQRLSKGLIIGITTLPTKPIRAPRFCIEHGGDIQLDKWLCDTCARKGIDKCKCGSHARFFGEALMFSVSCESCNEFVMGIDIRDIRDRWNRGERGFID